MKAEKVVVLSLLVNLIMMQVMTLYVLEVSKEVGLRKFPLVVWVSLVSRKTYQAIDI